MFFFFNLFFCKGITPIVYDQKYSQYGNDDEFYGFANKYRLALGKNQKQNQNQNSQESMPSGRNKYRDYYSQFEAPFKPRKHRYNPRYNSGTGGMLLNILHDHALGIMNAKTNNDPYIKNEIVDQLVTGNKIITTQAQEHAEQKQEVEETAKRMPVWNRGDENDDGVSSFALNNLFGNFLKKNVQLDHPIDSSYSESTDEGMNKMIPNLPTPLYEPSSNFFSFFSVLIL